MTKRQKTVSFLIQVQSAFPVYIPLDVIKIIAEFAWDDYRPDDSVWECRAKRESSRGQYYCGAPATWRQRGRRPFTGHRCDKFMQTVPF